MNEDVHPEDWNTKVLCEAILNASNTTEAVEAFKCLLDDVCGPHDEPPVYRHARRRIAAEMLDRVRDDAYVLALVNKLR